MNSDADRRLEGVLDREIAAALALAKTLDAERVALTGDSPKAVVDKASDKIRLFQLLERLGAERHELCNAAQVTLPPLRPGEFPVIAGVSETVAGSWRALLELIAGCRTANDVNGYIINARRGQISQLLQAIRGGAPTTYGPRGKGFAAPLRELARA